MSETAEPGLERSAQGLCATVLSLKEAVCCSASVCDCGVAVPGSAESGLGLVHLESAPSVSFFERQGVGGVVPAILSKYCLSCFTGLPSLHNPVN